MVRILFAIILFCTGCGETGFDQNVKTTKTKPQPASVDKMKIDALKEGAFLEIKKDTLRIQNATPEMVSLGAQIELNQKDQGYRSYNFEVRRDEIKTFENRSFDLTPESRLGFEVYRFQKQSDFLAVHFKFESKLQKSSQVVLVNLKANQPLVIQKFYFPLPNDFEIRKWSDEALASQKQVPSANPSSRFGDDDFSL